MPPFLSIVIPTLDGGASLLRALSSVATKFLEVEHEVVLVDNGSEDGSAIDAATAFPGVSLLRNPKNLGFAPACNQGARSTRGEFILFLNTDAIIDGKGLTYLLHVARSDPRGAVWQPVIVREDGLLDSAGDRFSWWGFLWHEVDLPELDESPRATFSVRGAALLVRRQAFEALGGFRDSYFAYFEESDLCWRARMLGWEVRVVPEVRVTHIGGQTTRRIFHPHEIRYLSFRNRLRSILANPSAPSLARILPRHLVGCLATSATFALRGRVRSAVAVIQALVWPVLHTDDVRRQREETQAARKVPDHDVFRHDLVVALTPSRMWMLLRGQLNRWERP